MAPKVNQTPPYFLHPIVVAILDADLKQVIFEERKISAVNNQVFKYIVHNLIKNKVEIQKN